jgi:broad specificity phosphatase PhoE
VACQIVLGFANMRDQVGPATVGECVENERQNPGNGNAEQRMTNGIMMYREMDGRMLFSAATRTWITGPGGLVERPNNQRFEWEGDRQMIEALQRGGHFIYFRHATTDRSQQDSDPNNLANCATQRNLTDEGRAQARAMGEAFRTLNIPIGQVWASEYCRALEHARLSFGRAEAQPSLVLPDPLSAEERQRNTSALQQLLNALPPPGTNTVMVSHSPNIRDAAGVDLPVEGGAAILRPNPGDKPATVARILPGEWVELAQALGPR